MHPKSPFKYKTMLYNKPRDDFILNFDCTKLKTRKEQSELQKIKTNLKNINIQLYNLNISEQICRKQPSQNCSHRDVSELRNELNNIKNLLTQKAKEIIKSYIISEEFIISK